MRGRGSGSGSQFCFAAVGGFVGNGLLEGIFFGEGFCQLFKFAGCGCGPVGSVDVDGRESGFVSEVDVEGGCGELWVLGAGSGCDVEGRVAVVVGGVRAAEGECGLDDVGVVASAGVVEEVSAVGIEEVWVGVWQEGEVDVRVFGSFFLCGEH